MLVCTSGAPSKTRRTPPVTIQVIAMWMCRAVGLQSIHENGTHMFCPSIMFRRTFHILCIHTTDSGNKFYALCILLSSTKSMNIAVSWKQYQEELIAVLSYDNKDQEIKKNDKQRKENNIRQKIYQSSSCKSYQ